MKKMIALAAALATFAPPALADTAANMKSIVAALEAIDRSWEPAGSDICRNEKTCSIFTGEIQLAAIGASVDVFTADVPFEDYADVCAAALAGLTSGKHDAAVTYVAQGFREAASAGSARHEIAGVDFRVKPGLDDRLECSFVKP
jgi:hypothetical protein